MHFRIFARLETQLLHARTGDYCITIVTLTIVLALCVVSMLLKGHSCTKAKLAFGLTSIEKIIIIVETIRLLVKTARLRLICSVSDCWIICTVSDCSFVL